jgi:hypothetical protein
MLGSFRSRIHVAVNWMTTLLLGRDVTYIADESEVRAYVKIMEKITGMKYRP